MSLTNNWQIAGAFSSDRDELLGEVPKIERSYNLESFEQAFLLTILHAQGKLGEYGARGLLSPWLYFGNSWKELNKLTQPTEKKGYSSMLDGNAKIIQKTKDFFEHPDIDIFIDYGPGTEEAVRQLSLLAVNRFISSAPNRESLKHYNVDISPEFAHGCASLIYSEIRKPAGAELDNGKNITTIGFTGDFMGPFSHKIIDPNERVVAFSANPIFPNVAQGLIGWKNSRLQEVSSLEMASLALSYLTQRHAEGSIVYMTVDMRDLHYSATTTYAPSQQLELFLMSFFDLAKQEGIIAPDYDPSKYWVMPNSQADAKRSTVEVSLACLSDHHIPTKWGNLEIKGVPHTMVGSTVSPYGAGGIVPAQSAKWPPELLKEIFHEAGLRFNPKKDLILSGTHNGKRGLVRAEIERKPETLPIELPPVSVLGEMALSN